MGNELYIGAPNGVVLCIDGINTGGCLGRFYHSYSREPETFASLAEMLFTMEQLFDRLNFPRRGNTERSFTQQHTTYSTNKEYSKIMSDKELLEHHGEQETFIVRVQHRQNSTWQGRITWADKNKTMNFRSIWEMIHLMEDALYEDIPKEEMPEMRSWNE